MDKRNELIKKALMDKLTGEGFNIYTADDILIVADITDENFMIR